MNWWCCLCCCVLGSRFLRFEFMSWWRKRVLAAMEDVSFIVCFVCIILLVAAGLC